MHILVLTNLYPPHVLGGYEIACCRAVQGLRSRGHRVSVLTSTFGVGNKGSDGDIHRLLRSDLETDLKSAGPPYKIWCYVKREITNQKAVKAAVKRLRPDLIYVWNPRFLPVSCIPLLQGMGIPVSFYVFDHWMQEVDMDPLRRLAGLLRRMPLGRLLLGAAKMGCRMAGVEGMGEDIRFAHVQFSTRYLQKEAHLKGIRPAREEIIYWGVERRSGSSWKKPSGRLLFVGQLVPHKGVHLAIETLRILLDRGRKVSLTLVGDSLNMEYQEELKRAIRRSEVGAHVNWMGKRSAQEIQDIYLDHDILVFPSLWEEPFGIVQLEAMQNGLAVVSSATGGAGEVIQHGVNALVYERNDPAGCADCIGKLLDDPGLFERLTRNAGRAVSEHFNIEATLSRMHASLCARTGSEPAQRLRSEERTHA